MFIIQNCFKLTYFMPNSLLSWEFTSPQTLIFSRTSYFPKSKSPALSYLAPSCPHPPLHPLHPQGLAPWTRPRQRFCCNLLGLTAPTPTIFFITSVIYVSCFYAYPPHLKVVTIMLHRYVEVTVIILDNSPHCCSKIKPWILVVRFLTNKKKLSLCKFEISKRAI